jgi:redox-sensing transcriptional repressor
MTSIIPEKTVGRLSLYRRILFDLGSEGADQVFSHQLAALAGVSAAQVRRDLMEIEASGVPARGYSVAQLSQDLGLLLDGPTGQQMALVGIGHLGHAVLTYFRGRRPNLSIVAAFDVDPALVGSNIHGCTCYSLDRLDEMVAHHQIKVAILATPAATTQDVAERLVAAGVRGLLNFAPRRLRLPPHIYVEHLDITMALERIAYFARQAPSEQEAREQSELEVLVSGPRDLQQ